MSATQTPNTDKLHAERHDRDQTSQYFLMLDLARQMERQLGQADKNVDILIGSMWNLRHYKQVSDRGLDDIATALESIQPSANLDTWDNNYRHNTGAQATPPAQNQTTTEA